MFTELQKERCRAVTIISAVPITICAFAGRHKNPSRNCCIAQKTLDLSFQFLEETGLGLPADFEEVYSNMKASRRMSSKWKSMLDT